MFFKAKDIVRASGLALLGISNSNVTKGMKKTREGKALSPLLLVRSLAPGLAFELGAPLERPTEAPALETFLQALHCPAKKASPRLGAPLIFFWRAVFLSLLAGSKGARLGCTPALGIGLAQMESDAAF